MWQSSIDLRQSRLDIEAFLKDGSLHAMLRRAVVDALEERALLFGSEAASDNLLIPTVACRQKHWESILQTHFGHWLKGGRIY